MPLFSLALEIISGYVELDPETQARNIAAWTPVMVEVLHCFYSLDKETVSADDLYHHNDHLVRKSGDLNIGSEEADSPPFESLWDVFLHCIPYWWTV